MAASATLRNPLTGLTLHELRARTTPQTLAVTRTLPVSDGLEPLFASGGLPTGEVVQIDSPALTAALLVAATQHGSWAAVVGQTRGPMERSGRTSSMAGPASTTAFGLACAAQLGVVLDRLAIVHVADRAQVPVVVAALVDALDVVVLDETVLLTPAFARRVTARARERGAVVLVHGAWPDAPGLQLSLQEQTWCGLGDGHGHLQGRRVVVRSVGRRSASRPRTAELWLQGGPLLWAEEVADESTADTGSAVSDQQNEVSSVVLSVAG